MRKIKVYMLCKTVKKKKKREVFPERKTPLLHFCFHDF